MTPFTWGLIIGLGISIPIGWFLLDTLFGTMRKRTTDRSCCEETQSCVEVDESEWELMKYRCLKCGRTFGEPEHYTASCLTCVGCESDGKIVDGCPWCGPGTKLVEINHEQS